MSKGHDGHEPVLHVDWIVCKAHGVCAHSAPELVDLDDWGYPIIAPGPVPPELVGEARQAIADCPLDAMFLLRDGERTRS